ncbi:ATP-binding protein [Staphylococcus epidermidis]|nr:ATP-binding protein [Staphylococcus epidermidis]
MREPLETGHITIVRAAQRAEFPARFQLIAAMNLVLVAIGARVCGPVGVHRSGLALPSAHQRAAA